MKEINVYKVKVVQEPEDITLESVVLHYEIAAKDMREVISTLTDDTTGVCKESEIFEIIFYKKINAYKYL